MEVKREFMQAAIDAAIKSGENGDYPIGAVVVKDDRIIAVGYETLKSANDPVNGHAEIDAIRKACQVLNAPYLEGCFLYSTHEPCPMCASASVWAKVDTIIYGVTREDMISTMKNKYSSEFSWRQIDVSCEFIVKSENPVAKIKLVPGFMKEECLKLLE